MLAPLPCVEEHGDQCAMLMKFVVDLSSKVVVNVVVYVMCLDSYCMHHTQSARCNQDHKWICSCMILLTYVAAVCTASAV